MIICTMFFSKWRFIFFTSPSSVSFLPRRYKKSNSIHYLLWDIVYLQKTENTCWIAKEEKQSQQTQAETP